MHDFPDDSVLWDLGSVLQRRKQTSRLGRGPGAVGAAQHTLWEKGEATRQASHGQEVTGWNPPRLLQSSASWCPLLPLHSLGKAPHTCLQHGVPKESPSELFRLLRTHA